MKSKKMLFIMLFLLTILFSCSKERSGSLVFWYNQATAQWLYSQSVSSCAYYVDGIDEGGMGINVYFTSAPQCGETGAITVVKSLGKEKSKTFSYKVTSRLTGTILWEGSIELEDGKCKSLQLIQ